MSVAISVVIPTRNRPLLVCRAVGSALRQTYSDIEVIVVIDGPDKATEKLLADFDDTRLIVIALQENVGGSEARNIGINKSCGDWVALLDDDDEWLPEKLEKQLMVASSLKGSHKLVASQYNEHVPPKVILKPRNFLMSGQAISDFIYRDHVSILGGMDGFPQTSTWLVNREFLIKYPFTKGLKWFQDVDWLLRAMQEPDRQVAIVPEPLAVFYNDSTRDRITTKIDWKRSYDWGMANRALFTTKSFPFFIVICCVNVAARQSENWATLISLLKNCFRYGQMTPKALWLFCLYSTVYPVLHKFLTRERERALRFWATNLFTRSRA